MMGYGFMGMFFFGVLFLLLLVGAAVVVVWLAARGRPSGGQPSSTARQLLDERLARGEISKEEHDELRTKMEH